MIRMIRNRISVALLLAAAVAAAPSALSAQKKAAATQVPATHTVAQGETLVGLAQQYLSDWHRWREIYDLNKSEIKDPHWIYPGQVLKMPGSVTSVAVSVAPAEHPVAVRPMPDTTQRPAPASSMYGNPATTPTVFRRTPPKVAAAESVNETGPALPTVLTGEYVRAPYVLKVGSGSGQGRLLKGAGLDANGATIDPTMFKAYDDVLIQPPAGTQPKVGDEYVVVKMGTELHDQGRVAIPTGVVKVTKVGAAGSAATANVIQLFGEMNVDQDLVPLDTSGMSSTVRPTPVSDGKTASITWILSDPVLPTTQTYAVVNLTSADGVHPGDEFTVYRPSQAERDANLPKDPAIAIARAKAVKVTPFGTTVIVTAQQEPAINVGATVRVSAKMQ